MKDEGSRPTLRSYLADSGVLPEQFLEALDILKGEIRALLEDVHPAPAAPPTQDDLGENESIRRILDDIKARWAQQDRAKARPASPAPPPSVKSAVPEAPPAVPPESGRITMETVILKAPGGARSPPRPPGPPAETPAADDQPTMFIQAGTAPLPAPSPSAPPKEDSGEMLLETIVRTSGKRPPNAPVTERKEPAAPPTPADDQPTTFIRVGTAPQPQEEPKPAAKAPEDDEMAKTMIFRPDQLRGKGKGGPK